jgi:hypothetical protein
MIWSMMLTKELMPFLAKIARAGYVTRGPGGASGGDAPAHKKHSFDCVLRIARVAVRHAQTGRAEGLRTLTGNFCASVPRPVLRSPSDTRGPAATIGERRTPHCLRLHVTVSRWFAILKLWWKLWGLAWGSGGNWRASQHPPKSTYPL